MLRVSEVATLLGVSDMQVRRLDATGKLVASDLTPGGHRLYTREHVEAFKEKMVLEKSLLRATREKAYLEKKMKGQTEMSLEWIQSNNRLIELEAEIKAMQVKIAGEEDFKS